MRTVKIEIYKIAGGNWVLTVGRDRYEFPLFQNLLAAAPGYIPASAVGPLYETGWSWQRAWTAEAEVAP